MKDLFLVHPNTKRHKTDLDMPLLSDDMYCYIANNFFQQLKCTEINSMNIHHFFDAIIAHRACFYALQFYELVDEMNDLLDVLVNYLTEVSGYNKYSYRDEYYHINTQRNDLKEKQEIKRTTTTDLMGVIECLEDENNFEENAQFNKDDKFKHVKDDIRRIMEKL